MKYTIKEAGKRFGDNNDWLSVMFEEHQNEPVLLNIPESVEVKAGMTIEGKIGKTKSGKLKLIKDEPYTIDRHQANIMSQWAVRLAAEQLGFEESVLGTPEDLFAYQENLYGWAEIYLDTAMRLAEEKSE